MTTARALLFGYAGGAALAAATIAPSHLFVAACLVLAAAASAVLAARFGHAASRRRIIALHAVLIPGQFALSVPQTALLLGMPVSIAILALMRPGFPRLRPRARKVFLTLHVGLSVSWLGLATAMTALAVTGLVTDDPGLRHHAYRIMHIFDLVAVIPTVLLSIITGLMVSMFTQWGLTKHWWVLTKFLLSISIPIFAGVQHEWIAELIDRTAADPLATPGELGVRLLVCFLVYLAILWTTTVLSIFKPGGKTPWAKGSTRNYASESARSRWRA